MKIDASVIQRLSQGDREAYTAVFREYYAPLVVYSSRIVKEREIAEDIVQEFFCYLWKQRRQKCIRLQLIYTVQYTIVC